MHWYSQIFCAASTASASLSSRVIIFIQRRSIINYLTMKVNQASKLSSANTTGKGFRRTKSSVPPVTSISWRTTSQHFLSSIAADKVGGAAHLPATTDEINKIAFGCYSAKDLPFILQAFGYNNSGMAYPSKKKELVKQAVGSFNALSSLLNEGNTASSNLNVSSTASMISVSPQAIPSASVDVASSESGANGVLSEAAAEGSISG